MAVNVSGGGAAGGTPAPVLSTSNAAGSAGTFLRTDDQLAIFDATVPVTQASADAAATGTAAIAARRDHKHGMPTISSGALTRAGGNTVEATTTSTTAVDLLTVSSLSIATDVSALSLALLRKSTGAANSAGTGLKINATVVMGDTQWASAGNSAQAAGWRLTIPARIASYVGGPRLEVTSAAYGAVEQYPTSADQPQATITSVIIRGYVGDGLITMGADEAHVYTYAVS